MFHLQPGTGVGFTGSREMALGLGGSLGIVPPVEPEIIHPMGSDPRAAANRARILREDEEILAIVMAFMEIKD